MIWHDITVEIFDWVIRVHLDDSISFYVPNASMTVHR